LSLALAGCGTGGYVSGGSQGAGKQLFVKACGGCHTLADAGTSGTVGPNLDDAFEQSRDAGMTSATFTQVVAEQIRYPVTNPSTGTPGMPGPDQTLPDCGGVQGEAFCVNDQDQAIRSIGAYVGAVAGTGVTVEAAATTLVTSPTATVCFACHDSNDAKAHFEINGGSIYQPRSVGLAKTETCMVCHGPGRIAAIADQHAK